MAPDASPGTVESIGEVARGLGARRVRRLFPGREDVARRSLYILELDDEVDAKSVSAVLRRHEAVESVEPAFERELA